MRESNKYLGGSLSDNIPVPKMEAMKANEKTLAKEALNLLKETKFPIKNPSKDKSRKNVLQKEGQKIEAFVLGKVRAYDKPNLVDSVQNKKHPLLHKILHKLVKTHNPSFKYTSIQINKSVETAYHFDRGNRGLSYCIALGNFTGGGVRVKDPLGKEKVYNNRNKWLKYDGHSLEHKTEPHKGNDRYAIIYYTHF